MEIEGIELFKSLDVPDDNFTVFVTGVDFAAANFHTSDWDIFIFFVEVLINLAGLGWDDGNVLINSSNEGFGWDRIMITWRVVNKVGGLRDDLGVGLRKLVWVVDLHHSSNDYKSI